MIIIVGIIAHCSMITSDKLYLAVSVCERKTDRLAEGDGCVSEQEKMRIVRVQVESRFAFCVFGKVCAEHSIFEMVRGHSWRECSCVGRQ